MWGSRRGVLWTIWPRLVCDQAIQLKSRVPFAPVGRFVVARPACLQRGLAQSTSLNVPPCSPSAVTPDRAARTTEQAGSGGQHEIICFLAAVPTRRLLNGMKHTSTTTCWSSSRRSGHRQSFHAFEANSTDMLGAQDVNVHSFDVTSHVRWLLGGVR